MTEEQCEALLAAINAATESHREYEESHVDAGNNYAHLPAESWTAADDKNLADFMRDNGIDAQGLEPETLSDLALDNFTMRAENIYGGSPGNLFCCGAYPIREIEMQLDYGDLSEAAGFTVTREDVAALGNAPDAYIGSLNSDSCLAYMTSDVVWSADISAESLRQAIADHVESVA